MFQSARFDIRLNKVLQILVIFYQSIIVAAFIIIPFLANTWLDRPFLGAFVEQTMVFNGNGIRGDDPAWDLFQEVAIKDRLLSIDGQALNDTRELEAFLDQHRVGETLALTYQREADGEIIQTETTLGQFPDGDRTRFFVIPYLVGVTFLAISLWIFGFRRSESAGRAFAIFSSSVAMSAAGLFELYTTHRLSILWTIAVAFAGGAMIDLALFFPKEVRWAARRPYIRWVGYLLAAVLISITVPSLYNFSAPSLYIPLLRVVYVFTGASGLVFIGMQVYRQATSRSPVIKQQARLILVGAALGLTPLVVWLIFISPFTKAASIFPPLLFLPTVIFPTMTGYAIMRQRMFRTDYILRQGMVYMILTGMAITAYAFIVWAFSLAFKTLTPANPWIIGIMVFALAVFLDPIRSRLQSIVDTTFFRGHRAHTEHLQQFTKELTAALDMTSVTNTLREQIVKSLGPEQLHIYIFDPGNEQYLALPDGSGNRTSDIRFAARSTLVDYLHKENIPLYLDGINLPARLQPDEARIKLLGALLFVKLPGKERPTGWLALGRKFSGQPYEHQDLIFLENLCDQASVAIERVQTIANLERRVQEMNALSRVSQGVNITLSFDDILELIFAQTALIIPTTDFHITLHNQTGNYLYYAFCVENNERLNERENSPLPENEGLGRIVIQTSRPILTQDYPRECQHYNALPAMKGVYAWMGVSLNAGAESIGSLSIASRDASTTYTQSQLDILQAIADQTTGAIVKARLLEETQQRALQLSTLNEIARQLTSTLETEPLLQSILQNAVDILNSEAGSLFLVDEQTDELIFTVTAGPVANDLLGQRLPPGTGIVGEAVEHRTPIIANDVASSPDWASDSDHQTGFITRAILAVPLQFKDRITGVIEVINRQDGLPFTEDDQTLLTAFAGQAAVAIENARLYTLTDQELAARVEELSVMQRIDRELNASLEMDRAMRITLEWAMRQSNADAGLIGMINEKRLQVVAQQGYQEDQIEELTGSPVEDLELISEVIANGQPKTLVLDTGSGAKGLLENAFSQIIIPIRREAEVIGLIVIEFTSDSPPENLEFINRLSDHAAIAISNAQLYEEVQRANVAKSEFVSLVAHELKNPMTSIKGYTELLSGGAIGEVNDMQANFLKTIHSNVVRMNTLVSDLNDQSKIEADRLRLEFKSVSLKDLIEDAINSSQQQIEEKNQTVETIIPDPNTQVWGDPTRLSQVLVNLVSNAHKYTPQGGKMIVGFEIVANQWDPQGADQVAHVWVKDDGIGIKPEDQKKIFQKFFRSDDEKAQEERGTGLGLNITKSLVEMQGGKIWFESEFRKGTTFHFTTPVAEA